MRPALSVLREGGVQGGQGGLVLFGEQQGVDQEVQREEHDPGLSPPTTTFLVLIAIGSSASKG